MASSLPYTFTTIPEGLTLLGQALLLRIMEEKSWNAIRAELLVALGVMDPNDRITNALEFPGNVRLGGVEMEMRRWIVWVEGGHSLSGLVGALEKRGPYKPAVNRADKEQWDEIIDLMCDYHRATVTRDAATYAYIDLARSLGRKVTSTKSPKSLLHTYVSLVTSRRNVSGWVVGGRGNTIHVSPDTWQLPVSKAPAYNQQPTFGEIYLFGVDQLETQTFRLDSADLTVLLPVDRAQERSSLYRGWMKDARTAKSAASTTFNAYQEWARNGGAEALTRQKHIDAAGQLSRPERATKFMGTEAKLWYDAALTVAAKAAGSSKGITDEDLLEAVSESVFEHRLRDIGGALTASEIAILTAKPDVPDNFSKIWEDELEKIRNPKRPMLILPGGGSVPKPEAVVESGEPAAAAPSDK